MTRLAAYLVRLFSADAVALVAIASILLFLVQISRTFDLVTVKGQGLLTLLGQSLLAMPNLIVAFIYVCAGIGLARGLRSLQANNELQVIHASRRTRALFGAVATFTTLSALVALALTHLVSPVADRLYNVRQSDIAADLVSRSLAPGKFIEMAPGVTLVIGTRGPNGEIGDFFADDRRDGGRRSFLAESAEMAVDDRGFIIRLRNGSIQYMGPSERYSEVQFETYDLAVDRLSRRTDAPAGTGELTTPELILAALPDGVPGWVWETAISRSGAALRVVAMCLLVTAVAAFPTARRRSERIPLEVTIVFVALLERAVGLLPPLPLDGPTLLALGALVAIVLRLRPFQATQASFGQ